MLSDIEIASKTKLKKIKDVASECGISENEIEFYGNFKAKLSDKLYERLEQKENGKLILVTAINPTPAGEGKTTVTIGLGQAMKKIGKKVMIALREPSLGPVFGIKGGAAGGGYSQVLPMEDINLHFTGDMHAITSANNLLCAMIDNHIHQGNRLNIDPRRVLFKRCLDVNDRALRDTIVGLGGKVNGMPREDGFMITVASEVMAILCLAENLMDLKKKLGNILVAYTYNNSPVYAKDLNCQEAMTILLKDAIKPNLVQTVEGVPALIHGGPFANIAHGCNSLRATKIALKLADYCITEAGFGSDLGAEKFFDIKCRTGNLKPSAVVVVATVRALKYNGLVKKENLSLENCDAVRIGLKNLGAHIDNMKSFGVPVVVAINRFHTDTDAELDIIKNFCSEKNVEASIAEVFEKGGDGGRDLALKVCTAASEESEFKPLYSLDLKIKQKIETIAKKIYGASSVTYSKNAEKAIKELELNFDCNIPVCVAKTQYSFSDNPNLLGRPQNFSVTVNDVKISNGAGFIVALMGNIMTMPGLPKIPAAENMFIDQNATITGLF